jgi:hypothetical protein
MGKSSWGKNDPLGINVWDKPPKNLAVAILKSHIQPQQ